MLSKPIRSWEVTHEAIPAGTPVNLPFISKPVLTRDQLLEADWIYDRRSGIQLPSLVMEAGYMYTFDGIWHQDPMIQPLPSNSQDGSAWMQIYWPPEKWAEASQMARTVHIGAYQTPATIFGTSNESLQSTKTRLGYTIADVGRATEGYTLRPSTFSGVINQIAIPSSMAALVKSIIPDHKTNSISTIRSYNFFQTIKASLVSRDSGLSQAIILQPQVDGASGLAYHYVSASYWLEVASRTQANVAENPVTPAAWLTKTKNYGPGNQVRYETLLGLYTTAPVEKPYWYNKSDIPFVDAAWDYRNVSPPLAGNPCVLGYLARLDLSNLGELWPLGMGTSRVLSSQSAAYQPTEDTYSIATPSLTVEAAQLERRPSGEGINVTFSDITANPQGGYSALTSGYTVKCLPWPDRYKQLTVIGASQTRP